MIQRLTFHKFSDETCRADDFTCANGKCIQKRWLCDLDNDCGDGSDEMGCPAITCSPDTEFQCAETYCIASKWVCDGDYDCLDGKDEQVSLPFECMSTCKKYYFDFGE